jgi:hypothetical protein
MAKFNDAVQFLIDNGVEENVHSGRHLLDHLIGTAELLMKWECHGDLVLAGLCHSIYGTAAYRPITVDFSRRDEVKEIIGDYAELLAWEFGMRPLPRLNSFVENNEVDLVIMECANLIEQRVDPSFLSAATAVQLPKTVQMNVDKYLKHYYKN